MQSVHDVARQRAFVASILAKTLIACVIKPRQSHFLFKRRLVWRTLATPNRICNKKNTSVKPPLVIDMLSVHNNRETVSDIQISHAMCAQMNTQSDWPNIISRKEPQLPHKSDTLHRSLSAEKR